MSVLNSSVLPGLRPPSDRARPGTAELTQVIFQIAGGDQNAFSELYRTTSAHVLSVAVRVLHDRAQADEVSQEVYLQVWQQASRFDPTKGTAWGWLTTMARRRAVDRVRTSMAAVHRDHHYYQREPEQERDEVWDQISSRHNATEIRAALARLTAKQREAIVLAYVGGHTSTEIATTLGIAVSTVKTRIRDGIISLRKSLPLHPEALSR